MYSPSSCTQPSAMDWANLNLHLGGGGKQRRSIISYYHSHPTSPIRAKVTNITEISLSPLISGASARILFASVT